MVCRRRKTKHIFKPVKLWALKHSGVADKHFNKQELKRGMRVEKEHTNSHTLAKAIAKAHLLENKNYYKKLKKAGL